MGAQMGVQWAGSWKTDLIEAELSRTRQRLFLE